MADPTEDMVRREIDRARLILQSDNHAASLKGLTELITKHFPDNSQNGDTETPPAPEAIPPKETAPKRKGIWWPSDE